MPKIEPMTAHALVQPIDCVIANMAIQLVDAETISIAIPGHPREVFKVKGGLQATLRWSQIERVLTVLERRGLMNDDIGKLTIDLLCSTTDHIFRDLGSLIDLIERLYKAGA
jgi:hypothetical protein